MKKYGTIILSLAILTCMTACGKQVELRPIEIKEEPEDEQSENKELETIAEENHIILEVGNAEMTATLDNSETTQAFIERLPMTITMNRYADREYYAAIEALPENGEQIDDYENGDITYFTAGSLAVFFDKEDSSSQANLIRMGKITSNLQLFQTMPDEAEVTISLEENK